MKKKYVAYAALLAMSLLLFTGCNALISNVFKEANLGQPSAEKIKEMKTDDLIEAAGLSSGEVSDTFIETVLSDADTLQAVKNTLQDTIDKGEPEEAQQASVLLINIELAENGVDDVVDNISKSIGNIFNQLSGNSKSKAATDIDYMALIKEMFPNKDKDTVAQLVNAVNGLYDDFVQLANLLNSNSLYLDHPTLAYLAQIALLSEAAHQIQNNYRGTDYILPSQKTTVGDIAADLYEIVIINQQPLPDSLKPQYFSPELPDMSAILAGDSGTPTMLYIFFDKAGMEDILTMLQGAVKDK